MGRLILTALLAATFAASAIDLQLTPKAQTGFIVDIQNAGDGSGRLFLVDRAGEIRILTGNALSATPFLDIRDQVATTSREQGMLSMAFPPDYARSGLFYVYYTDLTDASILSRFRVSSTDPNRADENSEEILLNIPQPGKNHNGGRLGFGPDGMLYLSLGDGAAADRFGNGQNKGTYLASILRLDVSQSPGYQIPPDNPFVNEPESLGELWAYGLRNPWRISFDKATGDLYIADVGEHEFEEINLQPADSTGGENYGWPLFEGGPNGADEEGFVFPVFSYPHEGRDCSITGGEVYRGPDYPGMLGKYIYGDYCSREIWALTREGGNFSNELLIDIGPTGNILTFGQDERGNLYLSAKQGDADSQVFLLSDGPPVQTQGIAIDGSLSGTYVVDGLNDQGFFVTVGENPSGQFLFVAWFTFDPTGAPRWMVGVAFFEPGATSVDLTMETLSGLPFLDFSDNSAERTTFGTMRFNATACGQIDAAYDFGSNGSGTLQLTKLTNIQGRDC